MAGTSATQNLYPNPWYGSDETVTVSLNDEDEGFNAKILDVTDNRDVITLTDNRDYTFNPTTGRWSTADGITYDIGYTYVDDDEEGVADAAEAVVEAQGGTPIEKLEAGLAAVGMFRANQSIAMLSLADDGDDSGDEPTGNAMHDFNIVIGTKVYIYQHGALIGSQYVAETDEVNNTMTLEDSNIYTYNNDLATWTNNIGDTVVISIDGDEDGNNSDDEEGDD